MLHLDAALTLLDHANDVAAADVLGTLAAETPAHATVHVLLAQACERLHRWDDALAAWQTARLLVPDLAVVQQGTLRAAQVLAALQTLREPSAARETAREAGPVSTPPGIDLPRVREPGADGTADGSFTRPSAIARAEPYAVSEPYGAADPYATEAPAEPRAAAAHVSDPYAGPPGASGVHEAPQDAAAWDLPGQGGWTGEAGWDAPAGAPAALGPDIPLSATPAVLPELSPDLEFRSSDPSVSSAPSVGPSGSAPAGSIFSDPFATAAQARRWDEEGAPARLPVAAAPPSTPAGEAPVGDAPVALAPSDAAATSPFAPCPSFELPVAAAPLPSVPDSPPPASASWGRAAEDVLGPTVGAEPVAPGPMPNVMPTPAPSVGARGIALPLPGLSAPDHEAAAALPSAAPPPTLPLPPVLPPADPRLPGVPATFDLDDLIESLSTAGRIVPRADFDAVPPPVGLDADAADDVVSPTLARIFAAQGQTADAIRAYERLAAAHPDRAADFLAEAAALRARPGSR